MAVLINKEQMYKFTLASKANNLAMVIPCYEGVSKKFLKESTGFSILEFKGELGESLNLFHKDTSKKILLVGLGKREKNENITNTIRKSIFGFVKSGGKIGVLLSHIDSIQAGQAVFGAGLANYEINIYKSNKEEKKDLEIVIINSDNEFKKHFDENIQYFQTYHSVMDLVNLPSNIKTPYYLADYAIQSGKDFGFKVKVFKGEEVKKEKLHAVYEVGKASHNPPAFIIMDYTPSNFKKGEECIGLVGKGVSFDMGGISIKPSSNMHYMKSDMAGAAAVIGVMQMVSKLKYNKRVIGIVPTAENALGGKAYRPGDIISSYSGKTIEIIDTDAEGRLLLADGISYLIKNFKPETIIDLATLTGSCVATFGYFAAGFFTQNDNLAKEIYQSGITSGEKVWRLPLWDDYKSYMNSDMADIKNLSSAPVAGAITAAKFLEFFTEEHKNWVHLDIAGVTLTDSDIHKSRTATGFGVKLIMDWLSKQN
jgi:leucyl aminopeptidase